MNEMFDKERVLGKFVNYLYPCCSNIVNNMLKPSSKM